MAGISQRELGALAKVSVTYPALIESGRRPDPGAGTLGRLAGVLGCTTDYLILGTEPAPTEEQVKAAVGRAREGAAA